MNRKPIIAGNWKLNKTRKETVDLATTLYKILKDVRDVDIVICPVYTALVDASKALSGSLIKLGAQDLFWEDSGAYTGEVSAPLIKDTGAQFVIIGHSERRQYFGETDESVNKKAKAALKHGLTPIVCIGELLAEREANKTFEVIQKQCEGSLKNLSSQELEKIIVAYEPVWAIGTGKTATPAQAQEVHGFIRQFLSKCAGEAAAQKIRIQYGGSVKPDNTAELMAQPDIDGALVGGASLNVESFAAIVKGAQGASIKT